MSFNKLLLLTLLVPSVLVAGSTGYIEPFEYHSTQGESVVLLVSNVSVSSATVSVSFYDADGGLVSATNVRRENAGLATGIGGTNSTRFSVAAKNTAKITLSGPDTVCFGVIEWSQTTAVPLSLVASAKIVRADGSIVPIKVNSGKAF